MDIFFSSQKTPPEKKRPFDPLCLLLINDAYRSLSPESILQYLRARYSNLSSLSSTVSRLRTRLRKIGLPESFTARLHLRPDAYRALRKRSRHRSLHADEAPSSRGVTAGAMDVDPDEPGGGDRADKTRRVSVEWASTTAGVPRMFECAYHILTWRKYPRVSGGAAAEPAHVYAALNLVTGLGPHELLNPNVRIACGNEATVSPHTGNFEAYWVCVSPDSHASDPARSPSPATAPRAYDRPCLFVASRVVQAVRWMRRAVNLTVADNNAALAARRRNEKIESTLINRRCAWARRALLKTFGSAVACDASVGFHGPGPPFPRNRNPDHRFTLALYVAATAANYFEGFSVEETAGYLNIPGDFKRLRTPFTPLVSMLLRSTTASPAAAP